MLSHAGLFATPWTVAHQAPLSMGFYRQEYWSGLPFPSSGYLLNSGMETRSPTLQADSLLSKPPGNPPQSYSSNYSKPCPFPSVVLGRLYNMANIYFCVFSHIPPILLEPLVALEMTGTVKTRIQINRENWVLSPISIKSCLFSKSALVKRNRFYKISKSSLEIKTKLGELSSKILPYLLL